MLDGVQPYQSLNELLKNCPKDQVIGDNLIRAWAKINSPKYKKIVCAISGGSDSDIVLDICRKCDKDNKIIYVWFDTGLEYQATKDHLKYLENKYFIKIYIYKAIKPIPQCCREYGQPFLSKQVSENIARLQSHGFQWEDEEYLNLLEKYCTELSINEVFKSDGELRKNVHEFQGRYFKGCCSALQWWCNMNLDRMNISRNKYLKEFIMEYPPTFNISNKCCYYAKKKTSELADKEVDLKITGLRKSEGGIRSVAYKSCFSENEKYDNYRPIFWYKEENKKIYETHYAIVHSKCYTEYGLLRTGCAGCPYGRNFEAELRSIKEREPMLYRAVNHIFDKSYEYTRKYREFVNLMNKRKYEQENGRQMEIFDYL